MPATKEIRSSGNQSLTASLPETVRAASVLKRAAHQSTTTSDKTHAQIADDVARLGAERIGALAAFTAVTVVGASILEHTLLPEMAAAQASPLYRLSALFLVLAGVGLAALRRSELISPQDLLDLGLLFEVAGACALALMENAQPWPGSVVQGSTRVAVWIAICVLVIPNRPWKSIVAAFAATISVPCAHIVAAHLIGYPA